jgi:hypothetical protein
MTVDEFIKNIEVLKVHYKDIGNYSITIHKHDKTQLSCSTTVPVDKLDVGFDWTMNQVILEPSLKLTTHPDETHEKLQDHLSQMYREKTNHLRLAAELSRMTENIEDEGLRDRFNAILKEF